MQATSPAQDVHAHGSVDADKPSCQGCRQRKLRCSRDLSGCTHCIRLGAHCVYDERRNKPGLKPGVIDNLTRRIDVLEQAVLEKAVLRGDDGDSRAPGPEAYHHMLQTLTGLCTQLCQLNERQGAATATTTPSSSRTRSLLAKPRGSSDSRLVESPEHRSFDSVRLPGKRRRIDTSSYSNHDFQIPVEDLTDEIMSSLPPAEVLEEVMHSYFAVVQPWVPILHETRFRTRVSDPQELPRLVVILHAMVVAALKFVQLEAHFISPEEVKVRIKKSRNVVVLNAIDQLSVENLQALIIVAFDDLGCGNEARAWPIIGSLTRTVEYLQLSVEKDVQDETSLLKPLLSLGPSDSWAEEEERRRVFWNIFNLDRFCSIFTGWNTSLTADDVRRRLPADGGLWHKEEPVITPFFGIWTRAEAKMGNSISFLPVHYPSPEQTSDSDCEALKSANNPTKGSVQVDMSTVGAFAYCIEATESLNQVTSYFLQQRINFNDRNEVGSWLTRFKELDLRLVHWKMFLPDKWKDSNISRQPRLINMDPNLTLAHLTHNTSMMLLHQRIAYPQAEWTNIVRVPSLCSAETCQNAAVETQNIAEKYLKYGPTGGMVTSQFAFCLFVAARVLLVHWLHYRTELLPEFWALVNCLEQLANGWMGPVPYNSEERCLADKFANRLKELHHSCLSDPNFTIDILEYSTVISNGHHQPGPRDREDVRIRSVLEKQDMNIQLAATQVPTASVREHQEWQVPLSSGIAVQDSVGSKQAVAMQGTRSLTGGSPADELSSISYLLFDQSFMDLDRVITVDEMITSTSFASQMDGTSTNA